MFQTDEMLRVENRPIDTVPGRDWVIIKRNRRDGTEYEGGRYASKAAATRYFNRFK